MSYEITPSPNYTPPRATLTPETHLRIHGMDAYDREPENPAGRFLVHSAV